MLGGILDLIKLVSNKFLSTSNGLIPFVDSLSVGSCIKRKSIVYQNIIIPSLDAPTCSYLLANSLEQDGTLVYGNIFDRDYILISFLLYLFVNDNVHLCIILVLYRGWGF